MQLAIVTCNKCRNLIESERPLLSLLSQYGIDAKPVVWNNPDVEWHAFDALLVRSIWDYHLLPGAFHQWLRTIESLLLPVWNPISVLRWNSHKFYLKDLARKGIAIVPTLFVEHGKKDGLAEAKNHGWEDVVIKPAVSASGYQTHACSLTSPEAEARIAEASSHGDFLIQPFLETIREDGEVSLIFFNHHFSHAVLKRPKQGDFRVQEEYGGKQVQFTPAHAVIETAQNILKHTGTAVLYARVDGILENNQFVLMELELIEPDLFLGMHPGADQVFAEQLAERLKPLASS